MATRRYQIIVVRTEPQRFTIESLAERAGMHPDMVRCFVEVGLIEPLDRQSSSWSFDDAAVLRLRTIERLRRSLGINLAGIAVVMDLLDRVSALQRENENLRMRR